MDKSALKKAYKQMKPTSGVFAIRDASSNKLYVGYGSDVHVKINRHKAELRFGTHRNRDLQAAVKSQGESVLSFDVLDVLECKEESRRHLAEELQMLLEIWIGKLVDEGHSVERLH